VGCEPTLNQVAGTTKRLIGSAARLNDEEAALLHSRSELGQDSAGKVNRARHLTDRTRAR
jgi:hypothetical protein